MYIAIDIGGTKTLVCALTNEGVIKESVKFATPSDYDEWKHMLEVSLAGLETKEFRAGTVAAPGEIDRKHDAVIAFGNLPWQQISLARDVERLTHCPMRIENDAKLGGLSEAMLLKGQYKKVLYITISTGIGIGLTIDQRIDTTIGDGSGRAMLLEHHGKLVPWESFASGSAIVQTYGRMASEIDDAETWKKIVHNLTPGFIELIAVLNPEVIVIGGGAGQYLAKFHDLLTSDLKKYETPLLTIPPIRAAQRPEDAVIYGCFDYARQYHD